MHIDWRAVSHLGAAIVGTVVPGVAQVEQLAWTLGDKHGKEKQDAVVAIVRDALAASSSLTKRKLADDGDVEAATRGVIDAVVHLQRIIATKAAAPAP